MIHVVWFKRDLRLHHHAPLAAAAPRGPCLPLYIDEPDYWALPDVAPRHRRFIAHSLAELDEDLRTLGGGLVVQRGDAVAVLEALRRRWGDIALYSHQETGNHWTFQRDRRVRRWAAHQGVPWREWRQFGVVRGAYHRGDRGEDRWARQWDAMMAEPLIPAPTTITLPRDTAGEASHLQLADTADGLRELQPPGRRAGLALLEDFLHHRAQGYSKAMSSPVTAFDGCSRLSPHLAYGTLAMAEVYQAATARQRALSQLPMAERRGWRGGLNAFVGRLHWHCHFIQKLESQPSLEWQNLQRACDGLRDTFNPERFDAWTTGTTGYPLVDACLRALTATGYLNFRMRALVVSFASYDLWLDWRHTGPWLARQFTDYEPGIHYSQLQMQSGTTGINTLRVYSPVKQSTDQDPEGHFIRQWVPELAGFPKTWLHTPWRCPGHLQVKYGCVVGRDYPTPVVDHNLAARRAKAAIWAVRQSDEGKTQATEVFQRHGSRRRPPNRRSPRQQAS
ncbi:MAG: deoxyribodipyrimidine photo-lyase/cryptochrome family protein [Candidatus Competibacterales bacterium]